MTGWYPSVRNFDNLQGLYLDCVYFSILLLIIPFHLSIFYQIKEALRTRGWVFNPDRESTYFDLKCTLSAADIDFNVLEKNQQVNHFQESICLTTKAGLVQTLSESSFFSLTYPDKDDFSPDAIILPERQGLSDYYSLHAETILSRLVKKYKMHNFQLKVNKGILKILLATILKNKYRITSDLAIDSTKHTKSFHKEIRYI